MLAWRFLVTAVVLLPWLVQAHTAWTGAEWLRQAVLALLCQCLYLGGGLLGSGRRRSAGTSALVASLQPALVLAAVWRWSTGDAGSATSAGLVLGSAGVALTAAGDLRAGVAVTALRAAAGGDAVPDGRAQCCNSGGRRVRTARRR